MLSSILVSAFMGAILFMLFKKKPIKRSGKLTVTGEGEFEMMLPMHVESALAEFTDQPAPQPSCAPEHDDEICVDILAGDEDCFSRAKRRGTKVAIKWEVSGTRVVQWTVEGTSL